MSEYTRREFAHSVIKSLTMYAFARFAISSQATEISQGAKSWSDQINEISLDLRSRKLSALEWQLRVEEVYRSIDLPELLKQVEFPKLKRSFDLADGGVNFRKLDFREVPGLPHDISYATFIFGVQEGKSIVPHGHHNLVSGHLVIEGNLHVRNFERLRDEEDSIVIRPTVDKIVSVRDCSTQSSLRNNVHWFTALGGAAFTFDVVVQCLDPQKACGRDYVDPLHATKMGDGTLRARRLQPDDANRIYGGSTHHP